MIGSRLKNIRKERNIKPEDIAKELSISVQAYYKYENDINEPNLENLKKLSKILHISIDELLDNKTNIINIEALEIIRKDTVLKILNMPKTQLDRVSAFIKGMIE